MGCDTTDDDDDDNFINVRQIENKLIGDSASTLWESKGPFFRWRTGLQTTISSVRIPQRCADTCCHHAVVLWVQTLRAGWLTAVVEQ